MELGKHLGKGIWGLADKALPAVYGLGFVLLVIRILPEKEFGNFVLIQEIFLVISGFAMGFALLPLLKYAAEDRPDRGAVIGAALFLNIVFIVLCSIVIVLLRKPLADLLNSRDLETLLLYLPALLFTSLARNFTLVLLQTRFKMQQIFWTDAFHFLGAVALVGMYTHAGTFDTAEDMIIINLVSLSSSSLVGLFLSRKLLTLQWRPHFGTVRMLWDYGKYSLGTVISYLFYTKADSFFLSAFAGPVQVAVYNSVKVFLRVFETMAQVINMFIVPAASRLASRGEHGSLKALTEKSISFATLGLIPVFVLFLVFGGWLVEVLYGGRYLESVPLLQIFSVLAFVVPLYAVASNALLGLGHAKIGFHLSVQLFIISLVAYAVCIPIWGTVGATIGYVATSILIAWITGRRLQQFIPFTMREVLGRTNDVRQFIRSRLAKLS